MKKHFGIKAIFASVLAITMLLSAAPLSALDVSAPFGIKATALNQGIYTYSIDTDTGTAQIIECDKNASGTLTLPSAFGNYPITSINSSAFQSCERITGVEIPSGVTTIGHSAFSDCSNLRSVTIPESVTEIQGYAFAHCTNLQFVTIPSGIAEIGDSTFAECASLESISLPDTLKTIKGSPFRDCSSLKCLVIPYGVTYIESMFVGCDSLKFVHVPSSVTTIYALSFNTISDNNGSNGYSYICSNTAGGLVESYARQKGIRFEVCDGNHESTIQIEGDYTYEVDTCINEAYITDCNPEISGDVTIPSTLGGYPVTSIDAFAFEHCGQITGLTISDSVIAIHDAAFLMCSGIQRLTLPATLKYIGESAFASCSKIPSVIIPATVDTICPSAFSCCRSLAAITVAQGNAKYTSDENGVLYSKTKYALYQYPCGNTSTSFTVPSVVRRIEAGAFSQCDYLTSIVLPDSVTDLSSSNIFARSENLKSIIIPLGDLVVGEDGNLSYRMIALGDNMFLGCTSLEYVHIPRTVNSIGKECFKETTAYICSESASSKAKEYAEDNGIRFVLCTEHIDNPIIDPPIINPPVTELAVLSLSSPKAFIGKTVDVTVSVSQNPGIVATMLSINYDATKLKLLSAADGGLLGTNTFIAGNDITAVPYSVLWDDSLASSDYDEDGVLVTFTFEVLSDAAIGETPVTITYSKGSTFNKELEEVNFAIVNGHVDITDRTPGDANGDGEIDLKDVAVIRRFLVGGWDVTIDKANADVNADGLVDLKDVALIKRYLAGGWGVTLI